MAMMAMTGIGGAARGTGAAAIAGWRGTGGGTVEGMGGIGGGPVGSRSETSGCSSVGQMEASSGYSLPQ
jgi:hypothetical protein